MAENKRSEFQRENDLKKAAKMYLQGKTQQEIAEAIGVSRQQIGYDIDEIVSRWKDSQLKDIDKKKVLEVERLNKVENEAWKGWERSWGKLDKSMIKSKANGDIEEVITTYEMVGNAKFLAVILKCSEQRCKILGLDEQEKQSDTDEGLLAELASMLKDSENDSSSDT